MANMMKCVFCKKHCTKVVRTCLEASEYRYPGFRSLCEECWEARMTRRGYVLKSIDADGVKFYEYADK